MIAAGCSKVFVVDDDNAVRDSIKILLEVHGIEVEDFGSIDAFISHYRKPAHGCLILDQHLPGVTGLDFFSSPQGKAVGIPVILITGQGDADLERRARAAGVADYMQKPVSGAILMDAVERALNSI